MTDETAERNISEFLDEHGIEGVLTLYFTNYMVELILNEVRSESQGTDLIDDPGVQYYFSEYSLDPDPGIQRFEDELFDECKPKAREMVQELKEDEEFAHLFDEKPDEEVVDMLDEPALEERFQEKMHDLFGQWEMERDDE